MTQTPEHAPPASLADIATLPDPDTADVAAVARYLTVEAIRLRVRSETDPNRFPAADEVKAQNVLLAALHFARALDFVCGHPDAALPRRADRTAQEVATTWRGGAHGERLFIDHDERLFIYCSAFGLDYDGVRRLAEAEIAADRVRTDGAGTADAGTDEEALEAAATALRLPDDAIAAAAEAIDAEYYENTRRHIKRWARDIAILALEAAWPLLPALPGAVHRDPAWRPE